MIDPSILHRQYPSTSNDDDIAIVGMSCLFPKAPSLQRYWQNIVDKVDAVGDPPDDWDAAHYYDPDSTANDRIYCKKGGYLGDLARFDPLQYGIMPNSIDGGEPDQFLALKVAHEALQDAGFFEQPVDNTRVEVIIGRGTYINRGFTTVVQHGLVVDRVLEILQQLHPEHTDEEIRTLKENLKASLPPFNAEMAPALVPNIMSGRIANRLDFMGPNYTVDAACASSLIALDQGMQDLRSRRCDMALIGGVHASTPSPILMIFCQLNALSRKGQLRPFDKDADGTLLGEGVGFVVLKRLEDARRDRDRVYAVLKGIGSASDGRALGLLAPRVEGEILALERAYTSSAIDPESIGLIEAHGTGTPVGDAAEIEALHTVFGENGAGYPHCALGTVKSMISHLIPAAGIAGVIKAALALHHKVLPPTLHCEEPNPALNLDRSPFYLNTESRPWIHGGPEPRRAGVNAFGFGGINAHAILEEDTGDVSTDTRSLHIDWDSEVIIISADSRQGLLDRMGQLQSRLASDIRLCDLAYTLNSSLQLAGPRIGIVAHSIDDLHRKLERSIGYLKEESRRRVQDIEGIYFFDGAEHTSEKIAFLFPGEGSQYPNMLLDLCTHFPEVRAWFDLIDETFTGHREMLPGQIIFPPPGKITEAEQLLWQMDYGPEAIFAANQAIFTLLCNLQIKPDAIVGHSTGEYSALVAAGAQKISSREQLAADILSLNNRYRELSEHGLIEKGVLLTVGFAPLDTVQDLLRDREGQVFVAMDNCPNQWILFGREKEIGEVQAKLQKRGAICDRLPFDRAYHTPLFESFTRELEPFFEGLEFTAPHIPLYSSSEAGRYPEDAAGVRKRAVEQWAKPVRFRETIQAMYDDGIRIFIEVGPRNNLTAFVSDILRGRPYLAVASDVPNRSGITQLNHLVALLAARGVELNLESLYASRSVHRVDEPAEGTDTAGISRSMKLSMSLQPLKLDMTSLQQNGHGEASKDRIESLPRSKPPASNSTPPPADSETGSEKPPSPKRVGHVAMDAYFDTMDNFLRLQREVMSSFMQQASHPPQKNVLLQDVDDQHDQVNLPKKVDVEEESIRTDTLDDITRVLLEIVSDRTGYPVEILNPEVDLESELSIDSIKRVEILGLFQKQTGLLQGPDMDEVSSFKTIQQIVEFVASRVQNGRPTGQLETRELTAASAYLQEASAELPFIRQIVTHTKGEYLEVDCILTLSEDLFLKDHTIGRNVSRVDSELLALPVVPLTISIEMLAEAAAALFPGKTVVGMEDVRAYRWITVERGEIGLRISARRDSEDGDKVVVRMHEITGGNAPDLESIPIIESVVILAGDYPEAPPVAEIPLQDQRPSNWESSRLYDEVMFHGPRFRGVRSMDRWGSDGSVATLQGLPAGNLFGSFSAPTFLTDPVVLDAAGQVIGFWTAEHMERNFHVFPFKVEAIRFYRGAVPPGESVECQARIILHGDQQIRSDIDMIGKDGRLHMRVEGWWDRQFDLPDAFYRLRIDPAGHYLTSSWEAPISHTDLKDRVSCRLFELGSDFLEAHGSIWLKVLAGLILSASERTDWSKLNGRRKTEWLMGRVAAKEAVRSLLEIRHELCIAPADIVISKNADGRPFVKVMGIESELPSFEISIAHAGGKAAALAIESGEFRPGIDLEPVRDLHASFDSVAFSEEERSIIQSAEESDKAHWMLRAWCAKESAGKVLGLGLAGDPQAFSVVEINAESGIIRIAIDAVLAQKHAIQVNEPLSVLTGVDGKYAFASTFW